MARPELRDRLYTSAALNVRLDGRDLPDTPGTDINSTDRKFVLSVGTTLQWKEAARFLFGTSNAAPRIAVERMLFCVQDKVSSGV